MQLPWAINEIDDALDNIKIKIKELNSDSFYD